MYGGIKFAPCGKRVFWMYDNVRDNFQEMLSRNIGFIHVDNTNFERIMIGKDEEPDKDRREIRQGVFDRMINKVSDNSYPF